MHNEKYENLKQLLDKNKVAYDYFSSLPQDIREKVNGRNLSIHTEKEMRSYAERLLSGEM